MSRWSDKVKRGMVGHGRHRGIHLLYEKRVPFTRDAWDIAFRIHFPQVGDLSDEELMLSLWATGRCKDPLPEDWPHGALRRAYERLLAEHAISDAAARSIGLFQDEEELASEYAGEPEVVVDVDGSSEVDVITDAEWVRSS